MTTTIKVQLGKSQNNDYIYVSEVGINTRGKTEIFYDIAAIAMMFRTCCIANKTMTLNKFHFVNWINKYTDLRASLDYPVTGRIDL